MLDAPFVSGEVETLGAAVLDRARPERLTGLLAGIARHDRPRGPMETVDRVAVSRLEGIHGDFRGAVRPGKVPRRQVTLMEAESWAAAMADLGRAGDELVRWYQRRVNLLVEGLRLPRRKDFLVLIGPNLKILVTGECDPCSRMEEIAPGLKAVLTPDWRGGFTGRVYEDGEIAIGDQVRIEE
jgi:MOSC domain-containing protein YiiM